MITDFNKTSETEKPITQVMAFFIPSFVISLIKFLSHQYSGTRIMLVEVVLNNDPTASIEMISRYKVRMLESFNDV